MDFDNILARQAGGGNYPQEVATTGLGQYQKLTFRQELETRLAHMRTEYEKAAKLLKLLDENPVIEEFVNLSR